MKTYTVIQGSNVFEIEADTVECHSGGTFLLKENKPVFAGPPGFVTIIDNEAIKASPGNLYDNTFPKEKPNES